MVTYDFKVTACAHKTCDGQEWYCTSIEYRRTDTGAVVDTQSDVHVNPDTYETQAQLEGEINRHARAHIARLKDRDTTATSQVGRVGTEA